MKYFTLLTFCLLTQFSFAQLTPEAVKKRAENKVENRANQKVDQAIDKGLNALEGIFTKKKKKPSESEQTENEGSRELPEIYTAPSTSSTPDQPFVPTKNEFIGNFLMEYRFFKNGKEQKNSPMLIEMHLDEYATAMKISATKSPSTLMIMHLDSDKMTIVSDLENQATAIEMKQPNSKFKQDKEMDIDVQKTGNKKNIDGYNCEEYIITIDGDISTNWTTKDIDVDWDAFENSMMALAKMNPSSQSNYYKEIDGFPIEITYVFKNQKEKTVIKTKSVEQGKIDKSLFDLSGYQIMKVPSLRN